MRAFRCKREFPVQQYQLRDSTRCVVMRSHTVCYERATRARRLEAIKYKSRLRSGGNLRDCCKSMRHIRWKKKESNCVDVCTIQCIYSTIQWSIMSSVGNRWITIAIQLMISIRLWKERVETFLSPANCSSRISRETRIEKLFIIKVDETEKADIWHKAVLFFHV